jgi:predicted negative regulator of RcsB-dependent stress response
MDDINKWRSQSQLEKDKHQMTNLSPQPNDSRLTESLNMAWASLLARKGKLQQAEVIMLPIASQPNASTQSIDLLAKIYAQQRKINEARILWLRALQMEPSNKHFIKALLRCSDLKHT